jgi:hypothetical protein
LAESEAIPESPKERIDLLLEALRNMDDQIHRTVYPGYRGSFQDQRERAFIFVKTLCFAPSSTGNCSIGYSGKRDSSGADGAVPALKDEESYSLLASELSADYFTNKSYRNLFMFLQQKVQELPRWTRLRSWIT